MCATGLGLLSVCLYVAVVHLQVKAPEKRQKIQGWLDEAERALNLRREEEETLVSTAERSLVAC